MEIEIKQAPNAYRYLLGACHDFILTDQHRA